jgi:putative ABC transport system permease protein
VAGDYFTAMGIRVLRGRVFEASDDVRAPKRVVINKRVVDRLFPNQDPVGQTLLAGGGPKEIIGVVADVPVTYRTPPRPMVYHAHQQFAADRNWGLVQVVATDGRTSGVADEIRRELAAIDPALVMYRTRSLRDAIGAGLAQERFALLLIALFAALAVTVAAIGLYGVLSYAVTRRRIEIGIRLALGAPAPSIRALIVKNGCVLALAGVAAGIASGMIATRWLQSMLFETSATDPTIFCGAALLVLLVALAASWIPARIAQRVDPLELFRRS